MPIASRFGIERELAGGVYGVSIGGLFSAESKFYRVRDASKVALVHLVEHLHARRFSLLDIQQLTPHTERLGAVEIPRPNISNDLPWPSSSRCGFERFLRV